MGKGKEVDISQNTTSFSKNVFVNCPFDSQYEPLLRPLLFTVLYLGYNPRIASERFDSFEQRIDKISELIENSKFTVHDISRMQASRKNELFRLNMPFELGIDYGCRLFKEGDTRNKICLVLDKERYRYHRALSDLSGVDIKEHHNEPEEIVIQIRNWFVENELAKADSATRIWDSFSEFMADFYEKREKEGFKDRDLQKMPTPEYINFIKEWLNRRES